MRAILSHGSLRNFTAIAVAMVLVACASSGSGEAPKPSKKMLKGTWQVSDIRFVGDKGLYKANLFEAADSACFKGSQWVFIPNNGSGKYTLNSTASQCAPATNRIHWSFFEPGDGSVQFQMKYLDEAGKTVAGGRGYRANIDELNSSVMVMRVPSTYQGNPFDVLMTFNKVSDDITL